MIFHENHLLADDSHEISYLIFFRKLGKMSQNLTSAADVISALRVNSLHGPGNFVCVKNNDKGKHGYVVLIVRVYTEDMISPFGFSPLYTNGFFLRIVIIV